MVKRQSVERPYNCGTMSAAEKHSYIISALRGLSRFWKPKQACIRKAKVAYNSYRCSKCGELTPSKLPPLPGKKRKRQGITADHILEVVPPETGWVSYDSFIERLLVEEEGWQALCWLCNHKKTQESQVERRASNKSKAISI